MKIITQRRFEALAGYIRSPYAQLISRELEWYSDDTERVLGVLVLDRTDQDFGGVVLGRDARRRFRAVATSDFSESVNRARGFLRGMLHMWSMKPDSEFHQGDEKGSPMDVFVPVAPPDRLHDAFLRVATGEGFSPARSLIESMMPYYEDVDGNFVEQFQTSAFDSRFWELYLFALLNEQGFVFDRSFKSPDFLAYRLGDQVFVEAVTVNPTVNRRGLVIEPEIPTAPAELRDYYREYMPIKWGSALTSKLQKKYWDLQHVRGKPLVLAVQDFHVPRAMTFLGHSITEYLYGVGFSALFDAAGRLTVKNVRRGPHSWRGKTIETGFFSLPGSEFVSAVVTNPTATISKFNRMAHLAGFGLPSVRMFCVGHCHDHDANAVVPKPFHFDVNSPDYTETWVQGANVFHNPNAKCPLDRSFLAGAAHHTFENGDLKSLLPEFHPYRSETLILAPNRLEKADAGGDLEVSHKSLGRVAGRMKTRSRR